MTATRAPESAPEAPEDPDVLAAAPAWARLWLAPVHDPLRAVAGTAGTPLAELTMPELIAWAAVLGYAALTGFVIGHLAANLALAAIRGPVVVRR